MIRFLFIKSPKYDFLTSTLIEGLNQIKNVEIKADTLGSYIKPDQVLRTKDELISYGLTQADFIIHGSNLYVDKDLYSSLLKNKAKKILIDGWDNSKLNYSFIDVSRSDFILKNNTYLLNPDWINFFKTIFKNNNGVYEKRFSHSLIPFPAYHSMMNLMSFKELIKNFCYLSFQEKVISFPFGLENRCVQNFNPNPKYTLASIMMSDRVEERAKVLAYLSSLNLEKYYDQSVPPSDKDRQKMIEIGASSKNLDPSLTGYSFHNKKYYDLLNNSLAVLCLPGGGDDIFRLWETLGAGALVLSKRIRIKMPHPLVEGVHYLGFDTQDDLLQCVNYIYDPQNRQKIDEMRKNAQEFAIKHHSTLARAKFFLQKISK